MATPSVPQRQQTAEKDLRDTLDALVRAVEGPITDDMLRILSHQLPEVARLTERVVTFRDVERILLAQVKQGDVKVKGPE